MSDLALIWNAADFAGDIALVGGDLAQDDGMRTAIYLSLFTDARARDDDALPDESGDRRGWWGDALAEEEGDRIGSRLWLLGRAKQTPATIERARFYAREALAWLVRDKVCAGLDVEAVAQPGDRLAIGVVLYRPDGRVSARYDYIWKGTD